MSKKRVAALGASAASAALVGSALFAPTALADEPAPSAFGIAAEGLIDIDKTPYAEGDDEKSTLDIPGDVLLDANVVNAEAHPGEAAASLEEIDLAPGGGLLDSTVLGVGSV